MDINDVDNAIKLAKVPFDLREASFEAERMTHTHSVLLLALWSTCSNETFVTSK